MRDPFESAYVCDYLEDARPLDVALLDMEHEQRVAVLQARIADRGHGSKWRLIHRFSFRKCANGLTIQNLVD